MTNKIAKKGGAGIYGYPTSIVNIMFFNKINLIKKAMMTGIIFAAMFMAAWLVMPASGATSSILFRTAKEAA